MKFYTFLAVVSLATFFLSIMQIKILNLKQYTYISPFRLSFCQPKTHVMFLKTHKTGSTTVQNIIFRFLEKKNLSLAMSKADNFHMGYPKNFSVDFLRQYSAGQKFDIMAHHMRFYLPEVSKVMHHDTFYFSIIRHPVSLMKSVFIYYNSDTEVFKGAKDLNEFLKSPWHYYKLNYSKNYYAKNFMWYDFGFDHNHVGDEDYFKAAVSRIESTFHLILINEYFEESMILLTEALCWSMDDVTYFVQNKRSKASTQNLMPEAVNRIKEWNSLDWKLYLHFNKTFWQRIEETIGLEQMKIQVQLLKEKNQKLRNTCLQDPYGVQPADIKNDSFVPYQPRNVTILGYNLRSGLDNSMKERCQQMIYSEQWYSMLLYAKQFSNASALNQMNNKKPISKISKKKNNKEKKAL